MAKPSNLAAAMFAVHASGIELKKDAKAVYGEYATLGNVLEKLRPVLLANDLYVEQAPDYGGYGPTPQPALRTRVVHAPTGEESVSFAPLVLDKETMQGVGSAITYARRYALVSIFGLDADEDDDGNAASGEKAAAKVVKRGRKKKEEVSEDPSPEPTETAKPRVF